MQQSKLQQSAFQQTTNNLLTGFTLGSLAVSTPLFIPQGDSKSLSFNVLAAVPLAVQLAKAVKLRKFPTTPKFRQPIETDNFNLQPETPPFVPETTGTAYLLVELLDENGNFVREVDKYYVSSQDGFTKISVRTTYLSTLVRSARLRAFCVSLLSMNTTPSLLTSMILR